MNERQIWPRTKSAEPHQPATPTHGDPLRDVLQRAHKSALVHGEVGLQIDIEEAVRASSYFQQVAERARPRFDGVVRPVKISVSFDESKSNKNVAVAIQVILTVGEGVPLDAGLSFGYGVGKGWGMEKCVHVNVCSPLDPTRLVWYLCREFEQECAYVEVDGLGWEVTAEREWLPIKGK